MEDQFALVYTDLVTDLFTIYGRTLPDTARYRESYRAAVRAWEELELLAVIRPFETVEEEIAFFKFEKPQVTGLIEYYVMCGQAAVQKKMYPDRERAFWKMELHRGLRFCRQQPAFCRYMEEGRTDQDNAWFRSSSNRMLTRRYPRLYNRHQASTCPKDWEAARYCASRLYIHFIEEQMV